MEQQNLITGTTEDEVWSQISNQLTADPDLLFYNVLVLQGDKKIEINIDIDLGGGFESGYETTTITAALPGITTFKFAIHKEHFTDEIGKFFGMQDVIVGHEDFDRKFIIKTNNEAKVKELFEDSTIRTSLLTFEEFSLGITHHNHGAEGESYSLEFMTEVGITDPEELRKIYTTFYTILDKVEKL